MHNHTWSDWKKDENKHWKECTSEDCTEKNSEAAHSWNVGAVTTEPTETGKGVKTYTCTVCQATKTEEIPATGGTGDTGTTTTPSTPTPTPKPTPIEEVSKEPTVTGGTANTVVNSTEGSGLVAEAQKPTTDEVSVKVEPKGDADTVNVELPATTVTGIGKADASLTVETPVANVTIPSGSLTQLGQSAGKVTVTAQKKDGAVAITVKKDNTVVEALTQPMTATVPAANATSGMVAVIVNADGTETIIKKSVAGDGQVAMQLKGSATVKLVENAKSFTDTPNNWSKAGIDFASSRNLFQGTSSTKFSPNAPMNRAMIVTVLHRLEDKPDGSAPAFGDVEDDYYTDAVAWATQNGIVQGKTPTSFAPKEAVTRQDLAEFLFRYANKYGVDTSGRASLGAFSDSDKVSGYAQNALQWCVKTGLIQGKEDGILDPKGSAKRSEVAAILMRFVQYINA